MDAIIFAVLLITGGTITYIKPSFAIIAYIIAAILPFNFQMVPQYDEIAWAIQIGMGFRLSDLILLFMMEAIGIKYVFGKTGTTASLKLFKVMFITWLYFGFEMLRNFSVYKINALGEFRYTYITIIIPIFIVTFFTTERNRIQLFRIVVFFTFFAALICIPFVGMLKGWGVGVDNRFLPSDNSLGLFYGSIAMIFGTKQKIIKFPSGLLVALIIAAVVLLTVDGHRSVWLAAFAVLIFLFLFFEKGKSLRLILPVAVLSVFTLVLLSNYWDINKFFGERSLAFLSPKDDMTANWRLEHWTFEMFRFYKSPIVGEGFGSYWGYTEIKGDVGVMPHNLYIMILAKLGIIGMALFIYILVRILINFLSWLKNNAESNERVIVLTACCCLVAIAFYSVAYGFENKYTWIFIGLGLSTIKWKSDEEEAVYSDSGI